MKNYRQVLRMLLLCAFLVPGAAAFADSIAFTTLPFNGVISGPAGSTIGWGYSIQNTGLNWLVTSSLSSDLFQQSAPLALFDFPIIAPGATQTVQFDSLSGAGLYQLTWDTAAVTGFDNNGTFVLGAEWWDNDPFNGGQFIAAAEDQLAAYSAAVSSGTIPVSEPSVLVLLCFAFATARFKTRDL